LAPRLVQVDAFASEPFRGNPAAVCILDRERGAKWMQSVAADMNLAATAFLLRRDGVFGLRWFTPTIEVALCGHATLASAHTLWSEGLYAEDAVRFDTKSGILTATRSGELIELDFPATPAEELETPPDGLLAALGVTSARYTGRNKFDYLVEVPSESDVRALNPDHARLRKLPARGVIVTSRGEGEYDFISRFFAPGSGIDEDPVTGSAHCCLAPYWSERLGRNELRAYQASPRGGEMRVRLDGDRVKMAGRAVTVLRGELVV
jgi:PhzF family phenazine biosynthesis protein